jgi:hypothetical protein
MASLTAKALAKEISENLGRPKGERLSLGALLLKHGYSESVSKTPSIVTRTKSFQDAIEPLVSELELERDEIIKEMKGKRKAANYSTLVIALDIVSKNLQLLKGKPTSIQFGAHVDLTPEEKLKLDKLLAG